jgi:DNA polymerase-3 subunit delta'
MFEEIIDQDLAKQMVGNCIREGTLPSALLFYGPEGVGKRTFALVIARVLNCSEVEEGCCGRCASCKAIGDLVHPNLRVIFPVRRAGSLEGLPEPELYDRQGTISIDLVRILKREATLAPYQKGKRVFVVLDADRMTEEARNAFLKLLEEPPADTVLILTTSRPNELSLTTLSRCQRIRFGRLPHDEIENALVSKKGADRKRARLVASLSGGSLGRAERMLEEYAEEHRLGTFDFVLNRTPEDDLEVLDLAQSLVNDDMVYSSLEVTESILRDLLAVKMGAGETVVNRDQMELLEKGARGRAWREICDMIDEVEEASIELGRNVNPRLVLFNMLSRIHEKDLAGAGV